MVAPFLVAVTPAPAVPKKGFGPHLLTAAMHQRQPDSWGERLLLLLAPQLGRVL